MTDSETATTWLQKLGPSRKRLRAGDLFTMRVPDGRHLFGRVVSVDRPREKAPLPGANLVYVYRSFAASAEPDPSRLTPDNLLLPPVFTNRLGWSRGYFAPAGHTELTEADLLPRHCFLWGPRGRYLDLDGRELPGPIEPCGDWALSSYHVIDQAVGHALQFA